MVLFSHLGIGVFLVRLLHFFSVDESGNNAQTADANYTVNVNVRVKTLGFVSLMYCTYKL